jgi:hypothetical protein
LHKPCHPIIGGRDVRLWGRIIGRVPFTDDIDRDVDEDAEGRQYVHGEGGSKVYGEWLPPADDPDIVE